MKISEMVLGNFRLFRHDQKLQFPSADGIPLTIVRAENRTGKTTLLTALQWCFYGDSILTDAKQTLSDGDLLVSADALREAKRGDSIKTQVEVRFDHLGMEYIARRVRETRRGESEADSSRVGDDAFTIIELTATGAKPRDNPTDFMNSILPENLRELFLFDRDRINRFMEPDHEDAVRKAVSDMLEFELFTEAEKDLKTILSEYRTLLRYEASGEAKRLRDEESKLEEELRNSTEELQRIESELRASRDLEHQLTDEIAGTPGDAGEFQGRIDTLEGQIQIQERAEADLANELGRQLAQGVYFTTSSLIEQARTLLMEKKAAGEIPKRIGEDLIKERLELGRCICGRPLTPGDAAHDHLTGELAGQKDRAVVDELAREELFLLNALARRSKEDLYQRIDETIARRARQRAAVVSLGQQITELKKRLGDIDGDKIKRIRSSLHDTRTRTQRLVGDRVLQLQNVPGLERELGDKRRRIRQAERTDKRNQALKRRERLAENCLEALILTYQNVREIERRKISERTQENFFRMNVRKDEFERVDVTPSFRLEVIAPGGQVVNSVLSGAQRRALSLSFLFALMQVSERDAPVVVDTPLGVGELSEVLQD